VRQIRDCSTYIADAASQPGDTQLLAYSSSSATQTFTKASIFTITDESDCGVTSCALYQGGGGCDVAYTAINSVVTIDSSFDINVKRDVAAGYGPESICYKCKSDQTGGVGANTGNTK